MLNMKVVQQQQQQHVDAAKQHQHQHQRQCSQVIWTHLCSQQQMLTPQLQL
jgi:hypothetical protein